MKYDDFFELFFSNLRNEVDNENFVDSIEMLIESNKITKNNFMKLLEEVYHE